VVFVEGRGRTGAALPLTGGADCGGDGELITGGGASGGEGVEVGALAVGVGSAEAGGGGETDDVDGALGGEATTTVVLPRLWNAKRSAPIAMATALAVTTLPPMGA
jgi:hypothetical protein